VQIVVPSVIGNESVKSVTACSTTGDCVQATVGEVEQVTDGYMKGNTDLVFKKKNSKIIFLSFKKFWKKIHT
jgi:hypothetical protein